MTFTIIARRPPFESLGTSTRIGHMATEESAEFRAGALYERHGRRASGGLSESEFRMLLSDLSPTSVSLPAPRSAPVVDFVAGQLFERWSTASNRAVLSSADFSLMLQELRLLAGAPSIRFQAGRTFERYARSGGLAQRVLAESAAAVLGGPLGLPSYLRGRGRWRAARTHSHIWRALAGT